MLGGGVGYGSTDTDSIWLPGHYPHILPHPGQPQFFFVYFQFFGRGERWGFHVVSFVNRGIICKLSHGVRGKQKHQR